MEANLKEEPPVPGEHAKTGVTTLRYNIHSIVFNVVARVHNIHLVGVIYSLESEVHVNQQAHDKWPNIRQTVSYWTFLLVTAGTHEG